MKIDPYEEDRESNAVDERAVEEFHEMLDNLRCVMDAARETSEGTVAFMHALRRGGFFSDKAN